MKRWIDENLPFVLIGSIVLGCGSAILIFALLH
jgi:hypothetical protein